MNTKCGDYALFLAMVNVNTNDNVVYWGGWECISLSFGVFVIKLPLANAV